jgi:glutaredoxin
VSPVITLYRRDGCHLCDEAREAIVELAAEVDGLELREIDIDTDDALLATYLERIPVVELEGEVVSELELDRHELLDRLHTVEP